MSTLDKRTIVATAAAAILAAGTAFAQAPATTPGQGQSGGQGKGAETGKGGTMAIPASPNAARSGMWDAELFTRLDTNKDGMISRDEAQADTTVRDAWSKLDAKNAGRVSRSDFDKYGAQQAPRK